MIGNMEVDPLIVIPVSIHDFLCIHPFNDGNGRMSRLLMLEPGGMGHFAPGENGQFQPKEKGQYAKPIHFKCLIL